MSNQHYDNDCLELVVNGKGYTVEVHATATYTHTPGRKWMPNGDPGYPDEDDFELDEVEATWYDENGNVINPDDEEFAKTLDQYLINEVDWEDDEEPEPDLDDYEDRMMERYEARCERYDL